jgi:transcriptional regulator with XRE-family HTH domain
MARVALNLGVRELAALAKVAPGTISRLEAGEEQLQPRTLAAIRSALEAAGVEFINGTGVKLRINDTNQA